MTHSARTEDVPSVAVCALTYLRPVGAARLIHGLNRLTFERLAPHVTIIIVDNDPSGSARETCESLSKDIQFPLHYVVERERGIANARNAALDHALHADWICFIDDDEVPEPQWLDELLRVQRECDADVVAGPVVPRFPNAPPKWVLRGRFLDYLRYPTGHRLRYAFTGNVLFRRRLLTELGLRFDKRLALTGGEDRHFFQRVAMAGYKIVWADNALAHEDVPASRVTARWILQRGFRYGNSVSNVERDLHPGLRTLLRLVGIGCYRICKGLFFLPLTWPLGRHMVVTYLRHLCYGAGMLTGCFGRRYEEYRKTHGA